MGFTIDFTPSVGVMGDHKNIYYGVAYNGTGVTFAQTAGRIITDLMAGEASDLTDLFVVNRKLAYAGPQSLRVIPWNLTKWYYEKTTSSTIK
jgi:gamma-glutamylputrescine oxidase